MQYGNEDQLQDYITVINSILESGLADDANGASELLTLVPKEEVAELREFGQECLKKTGLSELSEKI